MSEAAASFFPNFSLIFVLTGFGILESSPPDAQQFEDKSIKGWQQHRDHRTCEKDHFHTNHIEYVRV